MDKIAVLIPCYNESVTIAKVVADWKAALPEAAVYVYDNNSTDGTADIARMAGAVVRHEPLQGKGNVVRRMLREVDALAYLMVDGDDTYPPDRAREMTEPVLRGEADMVVGDRLSSTYFTENKRRFHGFGNNLVRFCVNALFHAHIQDVMTGCRAFGLAFAKTFPASFGGFETETEMTIFALDKGMRVRQVVIPYRDRPEGSASKLNTVRDGLKVLRAILTEYVRRRPWPFFGTLAALLALPAALLPIFGGRGGAAQAACALCALGAAGAIAAGCVLARAARAERADFARRLEEARRLGEEGERHA